MNFTGEEAFRKEDKIAAMDFTFKKLKVERDQKESSAIGYDIRNSLNLIRQK